MTTAPTLQKTVRQEMLADLTAAGHSAKKALEIALEVERGRPWAKQWLQTVRALKRTSP